MTTISVGPAGDQDTDGLLSGERWASLDLTYGFPTGAGQYGGGYGSGEPQAGFAPLNAAQQDAVQAALAMFAAVSGLRFTAAGGAAAGGADLRFAQSAQPGTAWAYYPHASPEGGDAWFGTGSGYYLAPRPGNYAFHTFLHETGHALGLKHGHETDAFGPLPAARDSMEYSVMTYRSHVGSVPGGYTNESWGYAQSLMMGDIAALQHMYGANYATRAGDTTYRWNPLSGELSVEEAGQGRGQGAPGGNRVFMTVWDGGGIDTYDFSAYGGGVRIDLRPGEWSLTATAQLAYLGDGQRARGNVANALLHAGDTRALIENATGGTGDDTLFGNVAANLLDGGAGIDTAVLAGLRADYVFSGTAGLLQAAGLGATDTLRGIEFVRFLGSGETLGTAGLLPADDYRDAITDVTTPLGRLTAGLSRAGLVESAGDVDVFSVSLRAGQGYSFTLRGGTLAHAELELRDVAGTLLASGADTPLAFTAARDGTYYLHARATDSGTGSYTLRSGFFDTIPDSLADTSAPAASLTAGLSRVGRVESAGDVDVFGITLRAGQGYSFDLRGAPSGGGTLADTRLELRDAAGTLLASNDDATTADAHIDFVATRGGTYHLHAMADGAGTGSYTLRSGFFDTIPDSLADNTAPQGDIAMGLSRVGRVESAGDTDVFAVKLAAGRSYSFDLRGAATYHGTLADPLLELRDASGTLLRMHDDGANDNAHLDFTATASGIHYLVARADGYGTGSYLLSAARQATAAASTPLESDPLWA
ncbi:M10 family metallopeptidase C-terminal domain-containing protein [Teichococcus aestuarii]|uniref:M10 family metallopeptidase C-terminal domain-containing protein n=1 Tax=Teichococcus aestuarii TaxID=568898 RepID=UPI001C62CB8A|nr:M10 family metallopeptidase C-terminal domain-containing protein [Pseudoroseomonas aestuarii]